ncbi:hypothetical protein D3C85_1723080 [compost metagenome]
MPAELSGPYLAAIRQLGVLAGQVAASQPNDELAQGAVAALAASLGQHEYSEFVLNVPKNELPEVMEWYWER